MRTLLIGVGLALTIGGMCLLAQGPPPTTGPPKAGVQNWADIQVAPNMTVVILRDNAPAADMVVVRTFFWQKLQGIEQPVLRSVLDVISAFKNVAVAANGVPDPKTVYRVHLDMVKLTERLEWVPPPPVPPVPVTPPDAKP